ncbi:CPBP family intramembrane glutamic endopeptidase [Polyangium aurulentum]|uniref:CPBP family intramembrane glutamic endopeptidase n=1 Tax=Polyangium aurulentum TaxID=2567896 RepID=UPI0010AE5C72|nr:CPBP family intramembrane glutamic endopeptidase [Polyangium aurulentum]UQA57490.1 CPBP family intramembrane metalloprotease [Polyangium aurulentum]
MSALTPPRAAAAAFAVLFVFYQLPEGVGMRLLGSMAVLGGLMLLFHLVAFVVARRLPARGYDAYAMRLSRGALRNLALLLPLALLAKLAVLLLGSRLGVYTLQWQVEPPAFPGVLIPLLVAAVFTFIPSVAEDILTRGLLYRATPGTWSAPLFVLVSAAVYVLNHVYRLAEGPLEWMRLFCFGLAYAAALARTGSLWAAIALHWGWNLANEALPLFVSTTVRVAWASPLLGAAAHLFLLTAVVAMPGLATYIERRKPTPPPPPPSPGPPPT